MTATAALVPTSDATKPGKPEEPEKPEKPPATGNALALLARVDELVSAVEALLGSEAMRSIGRLIQQLGIGELVGRCVAGLRDITAGLRRLVAALRRAADEKDGLSGLIGLLAPLVKGLGALARASSAELTDAGLSALAPALGPVSTATKTGEGWLREGETILARIPSTIEVDRLGGSVDRLIKTLDDLVTILQAPPRGDAERPTAQAVDGGAADADAMTPSDRSHASTVDPAQDRRDRESASASTPSTSESLRHRSASTPTEERPR